jgi:hypothetical protein
LPQVPATVSVPLTIPLRRKEGFFTLDELEAKLSTMTATPPTTSVQQAFQGFYISYSFIYHMKRFDC